MFMCLMNNLNIGVPNYGNVMTPEEGNEVLELVWKMSRITNRILILAVILILAMLALLRYYEVK